jgi:2-oxo-4-hydroxy-4-carboxy-5-ureidoimidazoline decarboxylase
MQGMIEQLQLICAHPELAGKAAIKSELTHYSQNEQIRCWLEINAVKEEFDQLQSLNKQYLAEIWLSLYIGG